ncbi:hypothetical protein A2U01_0029486, partial [Trifolium medium]|nr:hypothetical protein [Trifolium medium]
MDLRENCGDEYGGRILSEMRNGDSDVNFRLWGKE